MSEIKLIPCVCGGVGEYGIFHKNAHDMRFHDRFYIECNKCYCETPHYTTEAEAAEAWNKMQMALQSSWSSEVPTETGFYLCLHKRYVSHSIETYEVSEYSKGLSILDQQGDIIPVKFLEGRSLWFRINYPEPPKE